MQPDNNQNLNQNMNTSPQPPPNQSGAWDFLNTPDQPPPKPSFLARNKKFVILAGGALAILLIVTVLATVFGNSSSNTGTTAGNLPGATTTVPLKEHSNDVFTVNYPDVLNAVTDEKIDDEGEIGWYTLLAKSSDNLEEKVSIVLSNEAPAYENGEEAVRAMLDEGLEPSNVTTKDVVVAGSNVTKTVAEFTGVDSKEYQAIYASVEISDNFVSFNAMYSKDSQPLIDSFDAMVGSFKLK